MLVNKADYVNDGAESCWHPSAPGGTGGAPVVHAAPSCIARLIP
jgi:hypothetical protein